MSLTAGLCGPTAQRATSPAGTAPHPCDEVQGVPAALDTPLHLEDSKPPPRRRELRASPVRSTYSRQGSSSQGRAGRAGQAAGRASSRQCRAGKQAGMGR